MMRFCCIERCRRGGTVCLLASLAGFFLVGWSAGSAAALEIVVPAYFYPSSGSDWDDLNTAATSVPITAIMNPGSGPGNSQDSNYVGAVNSLRTAGGRVIGYVASGYAAKPLQDVLDEIDQYDQWYNIDGIFIDEMSNTSQQSTLDFYNAIYNHVKTTNPAWELMGNPGINTAEQYFTEPAADRLVTFESFGSSYTGNTPSAWNANYDSSKFVHLLHTLSSSTTAQDYLELAVTRNVGGVYFTDDVLNNPWDRLPTYWNDHVAKVAEINSWVIGAQETLSNPIAAGTITIDGSRTDWTGLTPYGADNDTTTPGPELDLATVTLANDNDELFLRLQLETTAGQPPALGNAHRVFIDTDGDRGTGYLGTAGDFALGAEYMLRNDRLFAFTGGTQQTFAWNLLQTLSVDDSTTEDIEWALLLADLGSPTALNFFVQGDNSSVEDFLPNRAGSGSLGSFFRYEVVAVTLVGDYDADGNIDADDFTHWRDRYGTTDLSADGNNDGVVNAADYTVWRDAMLSTTTLSTTESAAVPEPLSLILIGWPVVVLPMALSWRPVP